jgi:hypothetical protein
MLEEAPVFVGYQHREIARVDLRMRDGQPPSSVRHHERPQQAPVAVDDERRSVAIAHEIERAERV